MIIPETGEKHTISKKFWTYIKHCKQDSSGVAPLLDSEGKLVDDAEGDPKQTIHIRLQQDLSPDTNRRTTPNP